MIGSEDGNRAWKTVQKVVDREILMVAEVAEEEEKKWAAFFAK